MNEDKEKSGKVTFKSYQQHQISLLPPSLEDFIAPRHLVRVVSEVIDRIDLKILEQSYKGGGASNYHPRMMLKILVYAYCSKVYSCRRIDQALGRDIHFMWLSGMQRPDFRTINNFRVGSLKLLIEKVFEEVLDFLIEQGYVKLEHYFVDGTKLQADANKHTAVWAKNTERRSKNLQSKVQVLLKEIDIENHQEDSQYGDKHYESEGYESVLSSDEIHQKAAQLSEQLSQTEDRTAQRKIRRREKALRKAAAKMEEYEHQQEVLAGRRSYSKTDPDAIFMRMKDGQFLPAYNVLQGTENQFIINYTIAQSSGETHLLKAHLEKLKQRRGKLPHNIVGDAAYGSEENYAYLKDESSHAYLKYSGYYVEQTRKHKQDRFHRDHWHYDTLTDAYTCPNGQQLTFKSIEKSTTSNGYERTARLYQSGNCQGCSMADACKKTQGNKQFTINPTWEDFKEQARLLLSSDTGVQLRKQRSVDVESSFGDIKYNQGYHRFRLRGLEKVTIEWGLIAISHNLRKAAIKAAA